MSTFPHSRLFLGTKQTVLVSGPHIQAINSKTGEILHSTAKFDDSEKDAVLKSGPVRCAAVNLSETYLATSGDDKLLKVWQLDGLQLISSRELPKKPTDIQFTRDGQTILVSDKFGDIFSYSLHLIPLPPLDLEKPKRDGLTSHDNPSGGELILGHTSLLTSFTLSADEQYAISADRDEHIRVSWYPQGWNVEMYCLGHQKYVSAVHIPSFAPGKLISGGGDPTLKIWDWMAGKIQVEVEVWSTVQKCLKIKGGRKGRGWGGDDNSGNTVGTKKGKRKRGDKGKRNQPEEDEGDGQGSSKNAQSNAGDEQSAQREVEESIDHDEFVQVVHKISSIESETTQYILFSAVGATALFICPLTSDITSSSPAPNVKFFDFERPVLDFVVAKEGLVWVLLDSEWGDAATAGKMVRLVRWDWSIGEFKEIDKGSEPALLTSLNSTCLLPATPSDLATLDLYAHLSSMPKSLADYADGTDEGPRKKSQNAAEAAATKRELGRLKNKQALMRVVEGSLNNDGGKAVGASAEGSDVTEDERKNKRPRPEVETDLMDET